MRSSPKVGVHQRAAKVFVRLVRSSRDNQNELLLLVAPLVVITSLWLFIELADAVEDGETLRIDRAILLALRGSSSGEPYGPVWLQ